MKKSARLRTAVLLVASLLAAPLLANEILVDTVEDSLLDDGDCALREAMVNAHDDAATWSDCAPGAGADVIRFDPVLAGHVIQLQSVLPDIETPLQIIGPGSGAPALTIDGMGLSLIFQVFGSPEVTLENLILTRGEGPLGGAIHAPHAARLTLVNCQLVANAADAGGAIALNYSSAGNAELSITNSVIRDNVGRTGGGPVLRIHGAVVRIDRSEISDNTGSGAGILRVGDQSELFLTNTTISGNRVTTGAGGAALYLSDSQAELVHVTVTDNRSSGTSPPVSFFASSGLATTVTIVNSILMTGNSSGDVCSRLGTGSIDIEELGSFSPDSDCLQTSSSTAPEFLALGPLADNGGSTRTHALGANSVAVDAAGDCSLLGPEYVLDQRFEVRPGVNSSACDAGSYELQFPTDAIFRDAFIVPPSRTIPTRSTAPRPPRP